MKLRLVQMILVLLSVSGLQAQGLDLTDHVEDTTRISSVWDTWSMRAFVQRKSQRFSISDRSTDVRTLMVPNNLHSVGIGMTYKWISLDLGVNVGTRKGDRTNRLDLGVTLALRRNIMRVSFQRYRGYEVSDNQGIDYDFRSDVVSYVAGFTFLRAQRHRMLSLKSLTTGLNVHRESVGTFAYGAYWYWDQVRGDSTIVPFELTEFYNERGLVNEARQISLGVMFGYARAFVLPKDLFIFLSAFPGVGLNLGRLQSDERYVPPPFPALRISGNFALGYSGPKIYVIGSVNSNWNGVPWGDGTRYSYTDARFKISIGYRLTSEIPFLEKVADVLSPTGS